MGEEGFQLGMTSQKVRQIRSLEKANWRLKELIAEKELVIKAMKKQWKDLSPSEKAAL